MKPKLLIILMLFPLAGWGQAKLDTTYGIIQFVTYYDNKATFETGVAMKIDSCVNTRHYDENFQLSCDTKIWIMSVVGYGWFDTNKWYLFIPTDKIVYK